MAEMDFFTLRNWLIACAKSAGCYGAGVCTQEGREGGPPSTDLSRQLEGARAAIVFAYPVGEEKLNLYMGKIDHAPYQEDYIQANNIVQGIAGELSNQHHVQRLQPYLSFRAKGSRETPQDVASGRCHSAARGRAN